MEVDHGLRLIKMGNLGGSQNVPGKQVGSKNSRTFLSRECINVIIQFKKNAVSVG